MQCASVYRLIPALTILETLVAFQTASIYYSPVSVASWAVLLCVSMANCCSLAVWLGSAWSTGVLSWANLFLFHVALHPPVSCPCGGLRVLENSRENHLQYVSVVKAPLTSHPLMTHWAEQVSGPGHGRRGRELAGSWQTGRGHPCKLLPLSKTERGTPVLPSFQGLSLVC